MLGNKLLTMVAIASLMLSPVSLLQASDHLDAPILQQANQGDRDVNDLYTFRAPNTANTVLVLTVNPFAGRPNPLGFNAAMSGTTFGTDVTYEFNIDNNNDQVADVTYSTTFGPAVGGSQTYTTLLNGNPYAAGSTGVAVNNGTGSTVQAGLFDDPFFFDELGFVNGFAFTGDDTFAGYNVSAIVLEVPSTELNGADSNIAVWARTVDTGSGDPIDRVGRPAVNTAVVTSKDSFNQASPEDNPANAFTSEIMANIQALPGNDATTAAATTDLLLPDVLTFDTSPTATPGFLNGRQLQDDVIDAELDLLTQGVATSDGVPANDVAFSGQFPYLAPANPIPEPATFALVALGLAAAGIRRRHLA